MSPCSHSGCGKSRQNEDPAFISIGHSGTACCPITPLPKALSCLTQIGFYCSRGPALSGWPGCGNKCVAGFGRAFRCANASNIAETLITPESRDSKRHLTPKKYVLRGAGEPTTTKTHNTLKGVRLTKVRLRALKAYLNPIGGRPQVYGPSGVT
jgi:hypothetical protein